MSHELLKAVTAIGPGEVNRSNKPLSNNLTFQAVVTGGPTQVTISIEGSINGADFEQIALHDVTADGNMFHIAGKPVTAIKANLTVLTGGGVVTLTMLEGE